MPSYAVEQRKKKARGTDEEDEQLMGEAHRIFSTFSTFQNEKSKKGTKKVMALNKGQFMTLIKKMAQEKRIRFVSEAKIDQFIEREFPLHDVNQTGFLTLDEFVPLYRKYLTSNPDDVMSQLASTTDALEKLFLMFDKDKDMGLRKSEVIELCKHKTPPGLPEPAAEKLTAIVDDIYTKFDKDVSGDLDYDEFVEAYNDMVDQLGELHKEMRRAQAASSGFAGMTRDDDDDLEALEAAAAARYDGKTWVARMEELLGEREGGNVLVRARKAKKIAVCLNHPDQDMDMVTQYFSSRGCTIFDGQELGMAIADPKSGVDHKKAAEQIRAAVVEAMEDGNVLVVRLGHGVLDLLLDLNLPGILEAEAFTATSLAPGKPTKEAAKLLLNAKPKKEPERFVIRDDFHLVFTSQFHQDNWKQYMRGKLPLGEVQPVQMCASLGQVVDVMHNGVQTEDMDKAISAMDALADLL